MKIRTLAHCMSLALSCTVLAAPGLAQAQTFPDRALSLIVPYNPGGAVDVVGRTIGKKLGEDLKTSVVVENKAGFSGNIGAQYVARSTPDGYTLLMAALSSYSLNTKLLGPEVMKYHLLEDFKPVAVVGRLPVALVVNKDVPANNLAELIKYLKENPGKFSFGSSGPGSIEHVAGELFKQRAGVDILHVPYKGSSPAMLDLMSNQIQMMFATTPTTLANLPSGRIKAVGVATAQRVATLPDALTLEEQGLKGFDVTSLYGILVPKGTPDAIVAKLNASIEQGLRDPEVKKQLNQQGVEEVLTDVSQAGELTRDEVAKWSRLIDETKIVITQ